MSYNNYNNNNSNTNTKYRPKFGFNINTQSLTFFSNEKLLLKMSLINEALSLTLYIGKEIEGKTHYPQEDRVNITLTPERVEALAYIIADKFLPALKDKKPYVGGVFTNMDRSSVLSISTSGGDNPQNKLLFSFDIDVKTGRPNRLYYFPFNTTTIVENYPSEDSSESILNEVNAYLFLFIKTVNEFCRLCNSVEGHFTKANMQWHITTILKQSTEIAEKLGLTPVYLAKQKTDTNGYFNQEKTTSADTPSSFMDNIPERIEDVSSSDDTLLDLLK